MREILPTKGLSGLAGAVQTRLRTTQTRQNITRFSRRRFTAVTSEWHLAAAAHNLLKLARHQRNH